MNAIASRVDIVQIKFHRAMVRIIGHKHLITRCD